jgi:DNA transformation protein
MSKAATAEQARTLTDIPNIGESIAADLRAAGIATPDDVRRMEPFTVYERMRGPMGSRYDPCVLDVFLAAHDFMNGGPAQPWWHFTPRRKAMNFTKR